MESSTIFTFILSGIAGYICYLLLEWKRKEGSSLPPCLPWVPVLGSIPFLKDFHRLHIGFTSLSSRYGKVYAFYAANRYTVVMCGYDAIREALTKRGADFAGKENIQVEKYATNRELRGIGSRQYGDDLVRNRSLTISILKDFGYGRSEHMENRVLDGLNDIFKIVKETKEAAFDPSHILQSSTFNIIYYLVFGATSGIEQAIVATRQMADELIAAANPVLEVFPYLRYLPKYRNLFLLAEKSTEKFIDLTSKYAEESTKISDSNFIKEFLARCNDFHVKEELKYIVRDFLIAGIETTSTQLSWNLVLICNHPKVKTRLHEELDSVINDNQMPSLSIKNRLPYCEAVILETLRLKTTLSLAPHATLQDSIVAGFKIPANSAVLINLWSANMDPTVWTDPEQFRPERFLNEKNEIINKDLVITFSLGKRACPGEIIAKQMLFLYVSSIVRHFDILPAEGLEKVPYVEVCERTISPGPYNIRLVPRSSFGDATHQI